MHSRVARIGGLMAAMVFSVGLGTRVEAGVIVATNSTPGLFDASTGTRTVTFTGLEPGFGTGIILDIDLLIDFAKADGESYAPPYPTGTPYFNEVQFSLSRGSTVANLIRYGSFNAGTNGTWFDGTIRFDDEAAQVVNVNPNLIQAGTFRPVGAGMLSGFDGQSALGTFTLSIGDNEGADALRFRSFTLRVTTQDLASVPEPSTLVSAALGVVGLTGYARWRRRRGVRGEAWATA